MLIKSPRIRTIDVGLALDGTRTIVVISERGGTRLELGPEKARVLGRAIRRRAHSTSAPVEVPLGWRLERVDNPADSRVVVHAPNGAAFDLPRKQALGIGRAIDALGARAEERNEGARIAFEQAMLLRNDGIPFGDGGRLRLGLTADPRILDEAAKLAAWDTELRRFLPGGVRATAHMPAPGVFSTTMPGGSGALDPSKIIHPQEKT